MTTSEHEPHWACIRTELETVGVPREEHDERIALIMDAVAHQRCPRCGHRWGELPPARSRSTPDSCIKVCSDCGRSEAIFQFESEDKRPESLSVWPVFTTLEQA